MFDILYLVLTYDYMLLQNMSNKAAPIKTSQEYPPGMSSSCVQQSLCLCCSEWVQVPAMLDAK